MEQLIANTEFCKKIKSLVLPSIQELGFDLVRIKFSDKEKPRLQIMLDKDSNGVAIADCAQISTNLSAILDINDPINKEYELEISSPGINRPLTRKKDFDIWKGYTVKIKTTETIDNRKNFKGVLRGVENGEVLLEIDEGTIGLSFDWIEEVFLSIPIKQLFKDTLTQNTEKLKKPNAK